jgi:TolA-binding protein
MRNNWIRTSSFLFVFFVAIYSPSVIAETTKNRNEVFKSEELKQGELLFQKASEFYEDRNYAKSVEEVKLFLILYLRHPREWEARKLLSKSYRKLGDTLALAQNELRMYKDYPNTEEGLDAYLESARALIRLGKEAKATTILKDISQNTYSSKIAQEAELELSQLEILGESKNK